MGNVSRTPGPACVEWGSNGHWVGQTDALFFLTSLRFLPLLPQGHLLPPSSLASPLYWEHPEPVMLVMGGHRRDPALLPPDRPGFCPREERNGSQELEVIVKLFTRRLPFFFLAFPNILGLPPGPSSLPRCLPWEMKIGLCKEIVPKRPSSGFLPGLCIHG